MAIAFGGKVISLRDGAEWIYFGILWQVEPNLRVFVLKEEEKETQDHSSQECTHNSSKGNCEEYHQLYIHKKSDNYEKAHMQYPVYRVLK